MSRPGFPDHLDVDVANHGTVWTFLPLSDRAAEHFDNWPDDSHNGIAYVAEHRYALDIVYALVNDHGFTVAIDGRELAGIEIAA